MKKLLLSVLAVLGVMSVNAYEVNDFVYTPAAKFKVLGENVVTNGNFATGPDGWTDQTGADVNALSWQWTEGAGPNGENAMMSLSVEEGNVLSRVFELQPATYSISYWIMGEATTALVNGTGYANYAAFYVNSDASLTTNERQVNDRDYFNAEWRQIVDTVTISAGEYLVAYFDRMAVGTMVTGFEIHEIAQVYDTRIIEKELAFVKPLVENTELFPEQGEFPDVIGALDAALQGDASFFDFSDPSQIAAIEDFLAQNYEPLKEQFFASNSAEMLQHISYGDISGWPKFNNGDGKTGQGDWKFTGDRWGHANGAVDGNKSISGSYNLGGGAVYIEKAGLRAGKYLFSLEVNAEKYFKTKTQNDWYFPDYSYQLTGGKIFIGKDSVETGVFVNRASNFARHTIIAEVAEGDTLRAGFYFPGFGEDGAGRFGFKGAMLRLIGSSDADIALELLVNEIAASQNSLKVMIDSAKTVTAKNAEYPWGMDALIAAIPAFEDYLNSTYSIVDAEGNNVSLTVDLTEEQNALPTEINNQMSAMRTAIQNLYALNQPIYDIKDAIVYHREHILLEKYANAAAVVRAEYEASIAAAEALFASVAMLDSIPAAEEKVKFEAAMDLMVEKEKAFDLSCASYDAPADLQIPNGDFVNGGKRSKSGAVNDWTMVKGTNYKEHTWPTLTDIAGYEAYGVQTWRGYTAPPQMKLSQTSKVSLPGVYEFRVLGQGHSENSKYRGYYTIISDEETGVAIDTTFVNSDLYYFMGATGIPDSTVFHSQYLNDLYRPSWFSVCYIKETADEEEFEYGMTGNDHMVSGQGPNTYMIGAARLFYAGDVETYTTAINADLANYVAQANALLASAKGQAEANNWLAVKLQRYINDADAATTLTQKKNTIHRLKETMERFVDVKLSTPGDVNGDGKVLVDDVVLAINCVLGQADSDFIFEAGDMNSDGEILVDDVVLVINKVLGVTE